MSKRLKVTIIGAGNLAFSLATELYGKGYFISQIVNRTADSAKKLASITNSEHTSNFNEIKTDSDIYFVCTTDDAIKRIYNLNILKDKLLVHTSGSTPAIIKNSVTKKFGVFWPVQTFSKQKPVSFKNIPIYIESSDMKTEAILLELAKSLSENVYIADSNTRQQIHIAAVFACNFTNHMCTIASDLLSEKNVDFKILLPLLEETIGKLKTIKPGIAQTGPAVRQNKKIMEEHLNNLSGNELYKNIYSFVSESIIEKAKNINLHHNE